MAAPIVAMNGFENGAGRAVSVSSRGPAPARNPGAPIGRVRRAPVDAASASAKTLASREAGGPSASHASNRKSSQASQEAARLGACAARNQNRVEFGQAAGPGQDAFRAVHGQNQNTELPLHDVRQPVGGRGVESESSGKSHAGAPHGFVVQSAAEAEGLAERPDRT